MVGRGRLLVVNITVGDSGSATWVHHCIRTSAMTRCVFRRIIFFSHELGRPFFLLLRFFPFFLFFAFFFFFFFWNATAYFAQFAIRGYAPVQRHLCRSKQAYCNFTNFRCRFIFGIFGGQWFYFTEIKKTPKCEKHIERSRQHPRTPKFKLHQTRRDRSPPKFNRTENL